MAYATSQEFVDKYGANLASDAEINLALDNQTDNIDYFTLERINNLENGFSDLSNFRQDRVKQANLKGAYHELVIQGLSNTDGGLDSGVTSFKLGDLQIAKVIIDRETLDAKSENSAIAQMGSGAYQELSRSGLLYTGILGPRKVDLAFRVDEGV